MADAFEIEIDRGRSPATVVRVRGRVDGRTAPRLLRECLEAHTPGSVLVLNLAAVTFLSSAGVGALMVLTETLGKEGGVRLAPASGAVRTVLGLLNLDQFLVIDDSEDEALGALGA
jgi:anti-anti-sigma factor